MKKTLLFLILSAGALLAQAAEMPLWPEGVPGARNIGAEEIGRASCRERV